MRFRFALAGTVALAAACSSFASEKPEATDAGGSTTDGGTPPASDASSSCPSVFDPGLNDPSGWGVFFVGGSQGTTAIDGGVLQAQLTLATPTDTGSAAIQHVMPFAPGAARDIELGFRLRIDKRQNYTILGCQLRFVDEKAAEYTGKTIALSSLAPGELSLASSNFGFDGGATTHVSLPGFTYTEGTWISPFVIGLHFDSAATGTARVIAPVASEPMDVSIPPATTRLRVVCGVIYADTETAPSTTQLAIDDVTIRICP